MKCFLRMHDKNSNVCMCFQHTEENVFYSDVSAAIQIKFQGSTMFQCMNGKNITLAQQYRESPGLVVIFNALMVNNPRY